MSDARTRTGGALVCALLALICVAGFAAGAPAPALSDQQILKLADRARGNIPGGSWEVDLETLGDGVDPDRVSFDVQVRHNDFLAEYLDPPRQKGDRLLMVAGNMWFYKPGLSKPVPISQRQKLTGNAAYGDISATNYAEDYAWERQPDETRDGRRCYVYNLKSRPDHLTTYDRVRIWIDQDRLVGVRAEYFTVSGKLFKSVELRHDQRLRYHGHSIPFISEARFVDELVTGAVTVMRIRNPRAQPVDDAVFDVGFLTQ